MKSSVKNILKPFVPKIIFNQLKKALNNKQIEEWNRKGCPVPPPHIIKQLTIGYYQQKYGHSIFIESGTFIGEMVEAQKSRFKKVISIELATTLFKKAQKKFKNDENVLIVQGDSGKVLPTILKDIHEPAIFWLDGHYSAGETAKGDKECPIFEELDAILNGEISNHILLIDDARCFNGEGDYPTIERLTEYIKGKNGKYQVKIKHDIIRCVSEATTDLQI